MCVFAPILFTHSNGESNLPRQLKLERICDKQNSAFSWRMAVTAVECRTFCTQSKANHPYDRRLAFSNFQPTVHYTDEEGKCVTDRPVIIFIAFTTKRVSLHNAYAYKTMMGRRRHCIFFQLCKKT